MLSLGREVPTSAPQTPHCSSIILTAIHTTLLMTMCRCCTAWHLSVLHIIAEQVAVHSAHSVGASSDRGSRRGSKVTAAPVCLHTLMSNNSHLKSRTKLHIPLYTFMSKNTRHPKYLNYNFEQQPKEIVKCPVQQHPPSPDLYLGDSIVWVFHG